MQMGHETPMVAYRHCKREPSPHAAAQAAQDTREFCLGQVEARGGITMRAALVRGALADEKKVTNK